eukprot:TRINITY_DN240_c0_g1_i2.p2 TRINITY_DN240_c0_g1~~TRINITY_DN240_c0_g1_i2.p2  ORF type:complete len:205 (+),score=-27.44 TRINITY_DN240_c0_g1_i2:640-1254(+)
MQILLTQKRTLRTQMCLRSRGVALSEFPPLQTILDCCLPQESGPYLNPSVGDHPLRPPIYHRLGRPLPYQLTNRKQAHPQAEALQRGLLQNLFHIWYQSRFPGAIPNLRVDYLLVTHPFATLLGTPKNTVRVRLACLIHAASVRPEPGSNSPLQKFSQPISFYSRQVQSNCTYPLYFQIFSISLFNDLGCHVFHISHMTPCTLR